MDIVRNFDAAWAEHFPSDEPPDVFGWDMNNFDVSSLSAHSHDRHLNRDALEHSVRRTLQGCEQRIDSLQKKLAQENFLRVYLLRFLENRTSAELELSLENQPLMTSTRARGPVKTTTVSKTVTIEERQPTLPVGQNKVGATTGVYSFAKETPPARPGRNKGKTSPLPVPTVTVSSVVNRDVSGGLDKPNTSTCTESDSDAVKLNPVRQNTNSATKKGIGVNGNRTVHDSVDSNTNTDANTPSHVVSKPVPLPRPKRRRSRGGSTSSSGSTETRPVHQGETDPSKSAGSTGSGKEDLKRLNSGENDLGRAKAEESGPRTWHDDNGRKQHSYESIDTEDFEWEVGQPVRIVKGKHGRPIEKDSPHKPPSTVHTSSDIARIHGVEEHNKDIRNSPVVIPNVGDVRGDIVVHGKPPHSVIAFTKQSSPPRPVRSDQLNSSTAETNMKKFNLGSLTNELTKLKELRMRKSTGEEQVEQAPVQGIMYKSFTPQTCQTSQEKRHFYINVEIEDTGTPMLKKESGVHVSRDAADVVDRMTGCNSDLDDRNYVLPFTDVVDGEPEPDYDTTDSSDIRQSIYQNVAVKTFNHVHAALTGEDESYDSLSLNDSSDNETAHSEGDMSVDSGVGSKASMDSHAPISPGATLNSEDYHSDPYSNLYSTITKSRQPSEPVVINQPELPPLNKKPNQNNVPAYEVVDIETLDEMDKNASTAGISESGQNVRWSATGRNRRQHDYEECLLPFLPGDAVESKPEQTLHQQISSENGTRAERIDSDLDSRERDAVILRRDIQDGHHDMAQNNHGNHKRSSSPLPHELHDLSSGSSEEGDSRHVTSPEGEKHRMRHLVVKGILESEQGFLDSLEVLLQYMKSLEAAAASSQPVISGEDIKTIFFRIPNLHKIHMDFVTELNKRVKNWSSHQLVGDLFKILICEFPTFSEYMKNYQKAVDAITRCSQENSQFQNLATIISVPNSKNVLSLQNMLFKPVQRIQRNTLVLHDLLKCTPLAHPDHVQLEKALKLTQHNLEEFGDSVQDRSSRKIEDQQHLVKNSFVVETVGTPGQRKLRYIFLFNDVLICTKQKISSRSQRYNFEVKWFIPLAQLAVEDYRIDQPGDESRETRMSHLDEVEEMKRKLNALKTELREEIRKEKEARGKEKSWRGGRSAVKAIEKMKKRLHEQEAALVLASPNLAFKIKNTLPGWSGKTYTLLMSTDYEREEWSEAIKVNKTRCFLTKAVTGYDIQTLIENVKQLPKVNTIGSFLLKSSEEDGLNGMLSVTIHKLSGLTAATDTFCCLELDSYGHFFMTARTNVCRSSSSPAWDEEFEIDLEGAQTLRILGYRRGSDGDVLLGKSALELNSCWLNESFQEKQISLNEYSLTVSIRYVSATKTMKRLPSRLKTGVFGIKMTTLTKREGRKIPRVVTTCVEEIERRGLDETGMYRVSGVTSDLQRLKRAFDKNSRGAVNLLSDFDIHAVSGVLKLFFRELPEPLFTEALYTNFIDTLQLTDPEAKEKCMLSLLHSLPDPSLRTVIYLIDHLIRVSKHEPENRMGLNNLATIFGPTLLRPAVKEASNPPPEQLFQGAQEAMSQTAVLHYFIRLKQEGRDLTKQQAV